MPTAKPIGLPANYAQAIAVGYADAAGNISLVDSATPLPVALAAPTPPAPLTGTATASIVVGPFAPVAGTPVILRFAGTWSGSVQLSRSTDAGATRNPVTAGGLEWARFTGNACEQVWQESEAGALLYLDIVIASGSLSYRVSQ